MLSILIKTKEKDVFTMKTFTIKFEGNRAEEIVLMGRFMKKVKQHTECVLLL
jgi:hypothetical protein